MTRAQGGCMEGCTASVEWPRGLRCLEVYDEADTTMDATPPCGEGVVAAAVQRRGRGRTGPWRSPRGGAWLTVTARREPPPGLPVAVGGCLAARLEALLPGDVGLLVKWPNDVLSPDGGKLAGVLAEQTAGVLRVGVGVNVFNEAPGGAARLAGLGYRGPLGLVYAAVAAAVWDALTETRRCLGEAAARDALRGRRVAVETPWGVVEGRGAGIDEETGALLLETAGGLSRVYCCRVLWWRL